MAKRRGYGEGGLYKDADGNWRGTVEIGFNSEGKRIRRTVKSKVKTVAMEKLRALQAKIATGEETPKRDHTVAELCTQWLETVIKPSRAPKTYSLYEGLVRLRIIPHLGRVKVAELTPVKVQRFLAALAEEGVTPDGLDKTRRYLRAALTYAVKWEWATRNVAALSEPPKKPEREPVRFDDDDARRILDAIRGDELEDLFVLQLYLGLRLGEALGLREQDITRHPASGVPISVRITYQLAEGLKGDVDEDGRPAFHLTPPKTIQSRRTLLLPRRVSEVLERRLWANRLAEEAEIWPDNARVRTARKWGLVFRALDGKEVTQSLLGGPIRHDHARKRFYAALDRAGVSRFRTHDLRHLCATVLLHEGIPLKAVQEILGHASATTTLRTYAHALPASHAAAAAALNDAFGES